MLTEIIRRDPPTRRVTGPATAVDRRILDALAGGDRLELREIRVTVGGTTHHIHARLKSLVDKGLVLRHLPPGAPARGPGASLYQIAS